MDYGLAQLGQDRVETALQATRHSRGAASTRVRRRASLDFLYPARCETKFQSLNPLAIGSNYQEHRCLGLQLRRVAFSHLSIGPIAFFRQKGRDIRPGQWSRWNPPQLPGRSIASVGQLCLGLSPEG